MRQVLKIHFLTKQRTYLCYFVRIFSLQKKYTIYSKTPNKQIVLTFKFYSYITYLLIIYLFFRLLYYIQHYPGCSHTTSIVSQCQTQRHQKKAQQNSYYIRTQKNSGFLRKNGYSFWENIVSILGIKPYPFLKKRVLFFPDISGVFFSVGLAVSNY